ncbi:hypothetical protein EBE87_27100 [Pseudoroseomonas wenyumeiae]|uniref:Uncharacterized protein n=1 Tax=Teichococcus wenyumeiae TaxID=2478470 RepID=A0A3A9JRW3_9PROT|nr:hypothetical protein [Pseudoroseomonas wenyumeiae]RKK01679.1 hypothetical protein D6Z83_23730 [Pseudoroseomonas wenyumeiae]RMI15133.1 hypothetical protein EBE87_27100 [Pseudoroseomonas wenyumeiae]
MAHPSPELPPPHLPHQLAEDGPWKIWCYRGATVRSWGRTNRLVMPGHPLDGTYLSHHKAWFPLIDRWLDHGDLPLPPRLG